MVRKNEAVVKENLRGGKGNVTLYPILSPEELMGHGSMYALQSRVASACGEYGAVLYY